MSAADITGHVLLVIVVLVVLALAGIGLRDLWARRRAWEEYERRRDAIENGTRLANTRTKGGLPE